MVTPPPAVDVPPQPWTGRFDGDDGEHRRWWQAVAPYRQNDSGTTDPDSAGQDSAGPDSAGPDSAEPDSAGPDSAGPDSAGQDSAESDSAGPDSAGPDVHPAANTRSADFPPGHPAAAPAARPAAFPAVRPAVILGFASDEGVRRNKGRPGAAAAPAAIRSALGPLAFHLERAVSDAGDVTVGDGELEAGQARAGQAIAALLDAGRLTVVLGGGHETAYASYLGVAQSNMVRGGKRLGVLNLDAHFDLRDDPLPSSGTPFRQMAEAEAAAGREFRYAVVGISEPNNTRSLFRTAERLGVAYLLDEDCTAERVQAFVADFLAGVDVLYLTIDLDVMPASVTPGVSAPAAYGVPLPVIAAVCRQVAGSGKLLHLDVAELNPEFDVDGRTAKVAARLVNTLLR